MEIIIPILYGIVLLLTVAVQINSRLYKVLKIDYMLFINVFRLFSPKPIKSTTRIFYRDYYDDNNNSSLIEYCYFHQPTVRKALWYFGELKFYIIFRCIKGIQQMIDNGFSEEKIFKSSYYKKIEDEVSKQGRKSNILYRQIIFVDRKNYLEFDNNNIYLINNIHLRDGDRANNNH